MNSKSKAEKFCGNCDSHNSFEYPIKVFCSTRYAESKDPIVETLGCCDKWNLVSQDCYCVREAQKSKKEAKRKI